MLVVDVIIDAVAFAHNFCVGVVGVAFKTTGARAESSYGTMRLRRVHRSRLAEWHG